VHFDLQSRKLRERLRTDNGMGSMIGRSPEMEKVYRIVSKVAFSNHPVLILGESGTGKELVARSIHANGPNAARPFVGIDCGAVAPNLVESELFGHVKGAFTGATGAKEGLLSAGEGGTVFLDEICELPLDLQARLLRALQEKEVRPVGATVAVPMSARILAATKRDVGEMVALGRFRRDLFFRLNVVNIRVPAVRERRDDIRLLAEFFLERDEARTGVPHSFSVDAIRAISQYDWPGNVRELEHAIERACALSSGPLLHMADLPTQLQDFRMHAYTPLPTSRGEAHDGRILSIADRERHAIVETICQFRGDKVMAARVLGIGKTTLYRKLKEYGIAASEIGGPYSHCS
jgi:two-component system response regulator HydG